MNQTLGVELTHYSVPEYPKELTQFLDSLSSIVLRHDRARFMDLLDEDYKREQHDGFMMGNTQRFIDNFFCGYDPENEERYECILFESIISTRVTAIVPDDKLYIVTINVVDADSDVDVLMIVTQNTINGKEELRLIGAYG